MFPLFALDEPLIRAECFLPDSEESKASVGGHEKQERDKRS